MGSTDVCLRCPLQCESQITCFSRTLIQAQNTKDLQNQLNTDLCNKCHVLL